MRWWWNLTASTAALAVVAVGPARGDTILKGAAGSNPIPQDGVKVTGVQGTDLTYTTPAGSARTVALADVQRLTADGQPALNAAEDAYANRDYAGALDGYTAVLAAAAPDWVTVRAAQRLSGVARAQHRYDAAVTAYAALALHAPDAAPAARPAAPVANDPTLTAAGAAVGRALATASGSAKSALLGVQLDIDRADGDKAGVAQTLQQLVATGGASPADQAMLKLAAADVALDAKQYAQAEAAVQQNRALFTDPGQQVDALFVLAQARDGLAGTAPSPDAMKDAALSYMRVATFGGQLPDRPHVGESLVRAAQIEERLADPKAALALYQQVAGDRASAGTPAAAEAARAVGRLKK